ncbi:PREDICTED: methylmalonic aciduria and homocystinuria type C protein homolog isoform X2 [Amphimedon queenslandica]|uniref:Cyanocobalamin reductase (cyanide-eliminating) n=1 Tax=Amphimedon queenslandica TaxID=400682 RepID=A0AAN0JE57_AMPQE|nr:PREDICTED: methylmalonic aciduria and homocystinuria type C protein homolog isoform X2 [Amphimedon queenslandica]|eukprot:XP_019855037.1 PREDICTED: methylmalonic aciduria and homocystinuria type C protein homolog isoform X2 [Amphimedon queenslandica]
MPKAELSKSTIVIQWYNDKVSDSFKLPYNGDTLAVLIISAPKMFEELLKPFILGGKYKREGFNALKDEENERKEEGGSDPLDQCFRDVFNKLQTHFSQYKTTFIQDYELHHNRRPKILLQTAGHVSGSAYYYQRGDVPRAPWGEDKPIYGVSVHPRYGGWFAFRGVLIFEDIRVKGEELEYKDPIDCVSKREKRIELLEEFNYHWEEWRYRDILDGGDVEDRYSEEQKEYFGTLPKDRHKLVQKWREREGEEDVRS